MNRILLAEDDVDFGSLLKQYLELHQFEVIWAKNGIEGLEQFEKYKVDLCVLDVMMPKMDGFTLAEKIIEINPGIPFLFLTARKLKEDKIKGLKLGAEDYIVKPFEADILVLKIQNIIQRQSQVATKIIEKQIVNIGQYQFDPKRFTLTINQNTKQLTEKEAILIHFLYIHKNTMLKREEILTSVWQNEDYFSGRSMDVFISRIRKYFSDDPNISIESKRGIGLEFKVK